MAKDNEGFFKYFHETLSNAVDDVVENNFANLESNEKRVAYVCSLPSVKNYDLTKDLLKCLNGAAFPVEKDLEKARQIKNEGNNAVQKGDWRKALQLYSESLMYMPQKETEEASIALANRSAALNHLEQYEAAVDDIRRCLQLGYPRHLRYKVYERKARCLLVLQRNQEALKAFQDTISALDEATNLDKAKRTKLRTDAKIMIEMLHKGLILAGNPKDPERSHKTPPKPKLTEKANPQYPAVSTAIRIDSDDVRGRFAVATRDIEAGEVVLVENQYSGVLLAEFSKTHCQHCFVKCPIAMACPKCPNVVFCSEKCLETAQSTYHGYECSILPLIWKSGCSITCRIALRMITKKKKEDLRTIGKDLKVEPTGPYKSDDYRRVFHLVSHEDRRSKQDLMHRTQMTAFLVKLLEISGYFEGKPRAAVTSDDIKTMAIDDKYKEDVEFFGALVLKNIQVLQFNAHEVFELQCPKPKVGSNIIKHSGKSVFVGGALFSTLSLFNHSCDPSIVRYFVGTTAVVRAVKSIKKGEEVSENYGPIFTTVLKAQRRTVLKTQYWFDCNCTPCQQDWPLHEDMNENYMRFKCDSDNPCPNVIPVPHNCKEFMVQCGLCHQYTNILKGLKSLKLPQSSQEWLKIAEEFNNTWNFPHCLGALDGKHVVIQSPEHSGSEFINYKGTFSIVLLALVDADYNFIFVDCGCQGRISDGGVYRNTELYNKICRNELNFPQPDNLPLKEEKMPYVFLADSAFALTENMMKPYAGNHNRGTKERVFNYRLSRARRIVENVFGIMAAIFRVLRKPILLQPHKVTDIVMTCVLLHNFLRRSKKSRQIYTPVGVFDSDNGDIIEAGSWRNGQDEINSLLPLRALPRRAAVTAKTVRDKFAEYFVTNGSVSWQNNY